MKSLRAAFAAFFIFAALSFAQSFTPISDTLTDSGGANFAGQLFIYAPGHDTATGSFVASSVMAVPIANGVLSVSLPPSNKFLYQVFGVNSTGKVYAALWYVPASASAVTLSQITQAGAAPGTGTVDYPQLVPGVLNRAYISVTSTQIKNLVASPITVVAAPGANKIIVPVFTTAWYKRGSSSYTNTDTNAHIVLNLGTSTTIQLFTKSTMTGSTSFRTFTVGALTSVTGGVVNQLQDVPSLSDLSNLALTVANYGGITNYAAGDGTISIELIYRVIDLSVL